MIPDNFKTEQKKYARVRQAYADKEMIVKQDLSSVGIKDMNFELFIRAFKKEKQLELWCEGKTNEEYSLVKTYKICSSSGKEGPKRKQGDYQVPEGFYYIDRFNPFSNFYLSLGINYPNSSDKKLSEYSNPGGDIFIHGACVTIGCIPLTDDKIKEVYLYAIEAKNSGQSKIPVHIFPCKLEGKEYTNLKNRYKEDQEMLTFWKSLEAGYKYFKEKKDIPDIKTNNKGYYYLDE